MTPSERTAHEIVQFLNDQRDYVVPKEWFERILEIVGRGEAWVSVDESVPEEGRRVLWCRGRHLDEPEYEVDRVHLEEHPEDYFTHWRPLPEPPTAGQRSTVEGQKE